MTSTRHAVGAAMLLAFYESLPDDPFVDRRPRLLDGKARPCSTATSPPPSAATGPPPTGSRRLDRPMMLAMCLGMVADFDERAGDHRAAIAALEQAIELNDALGLRGFNGALLARLGWALLHADDAVERRRSPTSGRSTSPARSATGPSIFLALTGLAVVRRLDGRDRDAADAAVEALDAAPRRRSAPARQPRRSREPTSLDRGGRVLHGPRLHRRRRRPRRAGRPAARARRTPPHARPAVPEPPFLVRRRRSSHARLPIALLGPDAFAAAFGAVRTVDLGADLAFQI